MAKDEMTSFRLPGDMAAALRERAGQRGESLSDVMREAALMLLGTCPTCGRLPAEPVAPPLDEHGHHPAGDYDMWHTALYVPDGRQGKVLELLAANGIEVYRMWPVEDGKQHRTAFDECEASLRTGKDGTC